MSRTQKLKDAMSRPAKFSGLFEKIKKHKAISAIVLLLLCLTLFRLSSGFFGKDVPASPGQLPVYVELGEASFGTLRDVGIYYGSLASPYQATVASKINGQLKRLLVNIGDPVESGTVVAQLDDELLVLLRNQAIQAVALANAQHDEATANLTLARRDMERQSKLRQEKIVPASEYEAVQTRLRQAEARADVAKSQLENAKSQLDDATLKLSYTQLKVEWPEGGLRYVGSRLAEEGDLLNSGTPIFTLVSLDPLLALIDVMERDYHKISVGQAVRIRTSSISGESFLGRVARIAPVLSPTTRQARVEVEVPNANLRLNPGMFAEVEFVFSERNNVWSVPEDVPYRRKDGFVIFVADPQTRTVRQVPVTMGIVDKGQVELQGLDKIDGPVVFLGQHLLEDGRKYNIPGAPNNNGNQKGKEPGKEAARNPAPKAEDKPERNAQASETQASETQASETQTSETQASETQTSETQTSETQTSETQASETRTNDSQPGNARASGRPADGAEAAGQNGARP